MNGKIAIAIWVNNKAMRTRIICSDRKHTKIIERNKDIKRKQQTI